MSAQQPGTLRRIGLRAFRALPAAPSHAIIRLAAPTFSMGAVALIEYQGRVLALRQTHRTGWSLPGGLVDRGELPEDAVVREVQEETGLRVTSGDVFASVVDPGVRHIDMIYRIECATEPLVQVASEARAAAWFAVHELPDPDTPTRRIIAAVEAAHTVPRPGEVLSP
ncbi:NUDIX hydrolase [Luteipulveratus flavus]|uniref:NUDIX domain-containing protein n=1 Tax=Luteipulveratus flavus TaxID=3031728 RepID=A0ABT6CC19_9MICO|nr:NUDIX domain-containing protein [Luteipulveratus sp. YIM 133296]MDF8266431.1 NUDIX domain-containing protein [Luteipulveratus sp. YIM 133296]